MPLPARGVARDDVDEHHRCQHRHRKLAGASAHTVTKCECACQQGARTMTRLKTLACSVTLILVGVAPVAADNDAPKSLRMRPKKAPGSHWTPMRWAKRIADAQPAPDQPQPSGDQPQPADPSGAQPPAEPAQPTPAPAPEGDK